MPTKPISERKRRANRQNARKSTGPRTPEGKARSSRNAVKHGLLAQSIVVGDDPNENVDDFNRLIDELTTDLNPTGPLQRLLVERIAVCYWRLRRAYRFEARSILNARKPNPNPIVQAFAGQFGIEHDPSRHILPHRRELDSLVRYESMIDRELHRTMNQPRQLQSARNQDPHPEKPRAPKSEPSPRRSSRIPHDKTNPTPTTQTRPRDRRHGAHRTPPPRSAPFPHDRSVTPPPRSAHSFRDATVRERAPRKRSSRAHLARPRSTK